MTLDDFNYRLKEATAPSINNKTDAGFVVGMLQELIDQYEEEGIDD